MKSSPPSAVTRLAAKVKSSFLLGLDKLQRFSARKAATQLRAEIHTTLAEKHTPGAFGNLPTPHSRPQFRGNKLARTIANSGKVRGF